MGREIYRLLNIKTWDPAQFGISPDDTDIALAQFCEKKGISFDIYCTSYQVIRSFDDSGHKTILWDLMFWKRFEAFLDYLLWGEFYGIEISKGDMKPENIMKEIVIRDGSSVEGMKNGLRLQFLATMYQYLGFCFYDNTNVSYAFSLLYQTYKLTIEHIAFDDYYKKHCEVKEALLKLCKMYCVFHELGHLGIFQTSDKDEDFKKNILVNLKTLIENSLLEQIYSDNDRLAHAVRKCFQEMDVSNNDDLFQELYADSCAFELLTNCMANHDLIDIDLSRDQFIEYMYYVLFLYQSFNIYTDECKNIWIWNLKKQQGFLTQSEYEEKILAADVNHVFRTEIQAMMQWNLFSKIMGKPMLRLTVFKHIDYVIELENIRDFCYNKRIRKAILNVAKSGFKEKTFPISLIRDVLLEIVSMAVSGLSKEDLILEDGGIENEQQSYSYYLFTRGFEAV